MGIMDAWESWSQKLWDKWGKKIQPAADQIQSWDIPDWAKNLIAKAATVLEGTVAMEVMRRFAEEVCKKFDDDYAKALIEAVLKVFKKNEK